jgi:hypothetical protein
MSGVPAKRRRLDSDDDDDEYAHPHRTSPLMQYAVTSALPTDELVAMEYADAEVISDHRSDATSRSCEELRHTPLEGERDAPAKEDFRPAASTGMPSAAAPTVTTPFPSSSVPVVASGVFEDDEDVPSEYKGLFSTTMLTVFLVSLDYISKQKTCTDKLLAQYQPAQLAEGGTVLNALSPKSYHNIYGIKPGIRWDGVVRGRGPVV